MPEPTFRGLRPSAQHRYESLLRAGMQLAAERGMAGVTHRAVAARAGVSLGSTSYFFSSLDELMVEAIRFFVAERSAELEGVIARVVDDRAGGDAATNAGSQGGDERGVGAAPEAGPRDSPDVLATRFAETLMSSDRGTVLAEIEAYLHAARHPDLRPAVHEAFAAFDRVTEEALAVAGSRHADRGARAFAALSDGFLLRHLADPQPDDTEALHEALLSLAIAYAMPDDERERWRERLARPVD